MTADSDDGPTTYPVNLDLAGRRVLMVGAGPVAANKLERLLPTRAQITVVAPDAAPSIAAQAERGELRWHQRPYERGEVASYRLAITATGVPAVDRQVFTDGEAIGVFVNSADDPENCAFILPAAARQGPISIAIGTEGQSPALAAFLRRRYQQDLDDGMLDLLQLLTITRHELRRENGTSEHDGWRPALDDGLLDLIRAGELEQATAQLRNALALPNEATVNGGNDEPMVAVGGLDPSAPTLEARTP